MTPLRYVLGITICAGQKQNIAVGQKPPTSGKASPVAGKAPSNGADAQAAPPQGGQPQVAVDTANQATQQQGGAVNLLRAANAPKPQVNVLEGAASGGPAPVPRPSQSQVPLAIQSQQLQQLPVDGLKPPPPTNVRSSRQAAPEGRPVSADSAANADGQEPGQEEAPELVDCFPAPEEGQGGDAPRPDGQQQDRPSGDSRPPKPNGPNGQRPGRRGGQRPEGSGRRRGNGAGARRRQPGRKGGHSSAGDEQGGANAAAPAPPSDAEPQILIAQGEPEKAPEASA